MLSDFSILISIAQPTPDYRLSGLRILALQYFRARLDFGHQPGVANKVGDAIIR